MADNTQGQYGEEEAKKIQDYIVNYYTARVPPPKEPTREEKSFWRLAGFEAIMFSIPAMAMVIFSAIRTGGFFLLLEQKLLTEYNIDPILTKVLSFIIMLSALAGFEGYALARGIKQGRDEMVVKENKAGTILTFIVIISVGIFSGLSIVNIPNEIKLIINVVMAIITGLGAGIITFFGGRDIGIAFKRYDIEKVNVDKAYQKRFNEWREEAVKSYLGNRKRLWSDGSGRIQVEQTKIIQPEKKLSKLETAYLFVTNYYSQNGLLPTNQTIADNAGVSVGSAYKALASFIIKNEAELLERELVTHEQVIRAHTVFGQEMNKANPSDIIREFISNNARFPNSEDMKQIKISIDDAIGFVVNNQDMIRNNNLLDEDTIQQAIEKYDK